ncbi:hypothetical protein Hamer_G023527 [Homarus americanus]|uniref:Uncharacterized protein n=1 Tax=Homarus americanus TaxID=6706 RepID=A0A8J5JKR7_HOMAM|nr:hypothetical protein Hamer_G023527 [Homarus americanus]
MPEGPAPDLPPGIRTRRSYSARASPRHSPRSSPRQSRHGSLRREGEEPHLISAPIHLEPRVVLALPSMMHTLPLPFGEGEFVALSPLGTPLLTTPVSPTTPTPATPLSPIIPRIISTNWESLGAYDPYR